MSHKRKGQLTTSPEWVKHLRKIGKRFFWKGERLAEKKMIEKNMLEFETQTLSETEMASSEKLYDYLNLKLPHNITYQDLYDLCFSIYCTLDVLPENLRNLILPKKAMALTFSKIATVKNISDYSFKLNSQQYSSEEITNENHWIEQISNFLKVDDNWPNHKNSRKLLGTN